MKTVVINNQKLEVISLAPYSYMGGKGEKTLQIKVSEDVAGFEVIKELFGGSTDSIKYYENEELKCEYSGYNDFECKYKDGVYDVELHMASVEEMMVLLSAANERISAENAKLMKEFSEVKEQMNNIDTSGNGETTEIINVMLGLED